MGTSCPLGSVRIPSLKGETDNRMVKTVVSTNPVAASLDARNFKDPLSFKPERWLGDNKTDKLDASQPFSLGPRGCLGRRCVPIEFGPRTLPLTTAVSDGWSYGQCLPSYISGILSN